MFTCQACIEHYRGSPRQKGFPMACTCVLIFSKLFEKDKNNDNDNQDMEIEDVEVGGSVDPEDAENLVYDEDSECLSGRNR